MEELTLNVNWIAVLVGAAAAFLIGWLWYSPMLFGKKWAEGMGVEMGSASDMPVNAMALQAIGLLLVSWFVGVTAASNLLATVILATVAFTVLQLSGGMFGKQSTYARNSNAGYWIVAVAVMIVAQGIF
jgi:hypothetical protein